MLVRQSFKHIAVLYFMRLTWTHTKIQKVNAPACLQRSSLRKDAAFNKMGMLRTVWIVEVARKQSKVPSMLKASRTIWSALEQ